MDTKKTCYAEIGIFALNMDNIVGSIENTFRRTYVIIKINKLIKIFSKIMVPLNCQYDVPLLWASKIRDIVDAKCRFHYFKRHRMTYVQTCTTQHIDITNGGSNVCGAMDLSILQFSELYTMHY